MKKIILGLLFLCLVSISLTAAPRVVLWEEFTNTSCGPCASANPAIDAALGTVDRDRAITIWYHVNWPGSDVFNLHNTTDNNGRKSYYGVNSVPSGFLNGAAYNNIYSTTAMVNSMNQQMAVSSPVALNVSNTDFDADMEISVKLDVEQATAGNFKLHLAIIENNLDYNAANGEDHFDYVLRDMYPSYNGTSVNLSTTGLQELSIPSPCFPSWVPENLEVVAFIQNTATKEVIQAARSVLKSRPAPRNVIAFSGESSIGIAWESPEASDWEHSGYKVYKNQEAIATLGTTDIYYEDMAVELGYTYDYYVTATYTNPDKESKPEEIITMGIGSANAPTNANASIVRFNSVNVTWLEPLASLDTIYYLIYRDGEEVGSVDPGVTEYTDNALAAGDYTYTVKALTMNGETDASNSVNASVVLYSPNNFRTSIPSSHTRIMLLWSIPNDPTGRALTAVNVYRNDELIATRTGTGFPDVNVVDGETYRYALRAVYDGDYLSEETESITVQNWVVGTDDHSEAPSTHVLKANHPNPFNPLTSIHFYLENGENVEISIYNMLGQKVKDLTNQHYLCGNNQITWDGLDNNNTGVASGVYFYTMKAGRYTSTKKMILMK